MTNLAVARPIAGRLVSPMGLGCMNLSHAYGVPPDPKHAATVIRRALDLGITHFDTAALYGGGRNEQLLGATLGAERHKVHLASKCGMTLIDGKRVIDGRPETLKRTCRESLERLNTDVIDLYYLHRWDKAVPLEESVGALADLVKAGHIRAIGLSEVSAEALRRAHAIHPIAAVQSEYSLWTRNPEIAVLEECRRLGSAFIAFSPLTRGFLLGGVPALSGLDAKDIRRSMPRFAEPCFSANQALLAPFEALARDLGCTRAQLALAWILQKAPHVIPIPGTVSIDHLTENVGATSVTLSDTVFKALEALVNERTVTGPRYNDAVQAEVDTEEFLR